MHETVFVDSSIFIWSHNYPESNSTLVLLLVSRNFLNGVISEKVLEELKSYFTRFCDEDLAYTVLKFAELSFKLVKKEEIKDELKQWKGKIKDKDLEHLATVKFLGLKYLVAYDRDFEKFEEYRIPKQFIKELGLKPYPSEY